MKDIVANRWKLDVGQKLQISRVVLRENGPRWVFLLGAYLVFSGRRSSFTAK